MTTVSIRELHLRTGHYVRAATLEPLAVTDHGKIIAILQQPKSSEIKAGVTFKKSLRDLVPVKKGSMDSTRIISEDRDRE